MTEGIWARITVLSSDEERKKKKEAVKERGSRRNRERTGVRGAAHTTWPSTTEFLRCFIRTRNLFC